MRLQASGKWVEAWQTDKEGTGVGSVGANARIPGNRFKNGTLKPRE